MQKMTLLFGNAVGGEQEGLRWAMLKINCNYLTGAVSISVCVVIHH